MLFRSEHARKSSLIRARGRCILAPSALSLREVDAYYADSHVLQGVSFEAGEGRVLGLIGRNGAGKSTCMNVAVGLLPPRAGAVEVFGATVTGLPPEKIAALKLAYRLLYRSQLPLVEALERIEKEVATEEARYLVNFIRNSKRGICRE